MPAAQQTAFLLQPVILLHIIGRKQPAHADLQRCGQMLQRSHGRLCLIIFNLRQHVPRHTRTGKLTLRHAAHQANFPNLPAQRHFPFLRDM